MSGFDTKLLPEMRDAIAPDGSEVRLLLRDSDCVSTAEFRLQPGQVARAVTHKTVSEIWYVLAGSGKIWRRKDDEEGVTDLNAGTCIRLPLGTRFQFSASGTSPLEIFGVTTPAWPNTPDEARVVEGPWTPNV